MEEGNVSKNVYLSLFGAGQTKLDLDNVEVWHPDPNKNKSLAISVIALMVLAQIMVTIAEYYLEFLGFEIEERAKEWQISNGICLDRSYLHFNVFWKGKINCKKKRGFFNFFKSEICQEVFCSL